MPTKEEFEAQLREMDKEHKEYIRQKKLILWSFKFLILVWVISLIVSVVKNT